MLQHFVVTSNRPAAGCALLLLTAAAPAKLVEEEVEVPVTVTDMFGRDLRDR